MIDSNDKLFFVVSHVVVIMILVRQVMIIVIN